MKKEQTAVYSYHVTMLVHVVGDSEEKAKIKLDEQGGIMTAREVELLNVSALFGEKEEK